jgi:hypothetical protein
MEMADIGKPPPPRNILNRSPAVAKFTGGITKAIAQGKIGKGETHLLHE